MNSENLYGKLTPALITQLTAMVGEKIFWSVKVRRTIPMMKPPTPTPNCLKQ
jgi:hypothetical protein